MDSKLAKEMIRKGIEHNDPELIEMGNKILSQFFGDTPEKAQEKVEEVVKRGRGRPKKKTEQAVVIPETVRDEFDFTAPPKRVINDRDEIDDKRFTKRRPLSINIKPVTLDEHKEDSKIDQLLTNSNYRPQYRNPFKGYDLTCNNCEKSFNSEIIQSTCPKCLRSKR
jgi:hypothetical protein